MRKSLRSGFGKEVNTDSASVMQQEDMVQIRRTSTAMDRLRANRLAILSHENIDDAMR